MFFFRVYALKIKRLKRCANTVLNFYERQLGPMLIESRRESPESHVTNVYDLQRFPITRNLMWDFVIIEIKDLTVEHGSFIFFALVRD